MMKRILKKLLVWFVERTNFPHLLSEVANKRHLEAIKFAIVDLGATFYPESSVSNGRDQLSIIVGKGTHVRGTLAIFKYGGKISIGEHCYIGDHTRIWSGENITIGNYVQISHNVNIMDTNAHEIDAIERADRYLDLLSNGSWNDKGSVLTSPIVIGDYVWIGFNAIILKGVKIGEGAIVGANSVITKDVPAYTMVVGNPSRIIKTLRGNDTISNG